jgi:cytochrome c556
MSPARALALFGAGLFLGAMLLFMAMSALAQRHSVPRGTMALMQYHLGQLRQATRSMACAEERARQHLQRLSALASDAGPIFAQIGYADPVFLRHREQFLAEVAKAQASADCDAIAAWVKPISETCDACHHAVR